MISGQNVRGQESMTYSLSRHRRKQTRDQWTECPRTGINDLRSVKASEDGTHDQWTRTGINDHDLRTVEASEDGNP